MSEKGPDKVKFYKKPSFWSASLPIIVSLGALIVAILSWRTSERALQLGQLTDVRMEAQLFLDSVYIGDFTDTLTYMVVSGDLKKENWVNESYGLEFLIEIRVYNASARGIAIDRVTCVPALYGQLLRNVEYHYGYEEDFKTPLRFPYNVPAGSAKKILVAIDWPIDTGISRAFRDLSPRRFHSWSVIIEEYEREFGEFFGTAMPRNGKLALLAPNLLSRQAIEGGNPERVCLTYVTLGDGQRLMERVPL